MARTSYALHHQFPKLAEESGFAFNVHRSRVPVDWNKFRSIDIDSIIKERKFYLIEQHLNDILYCVLESEFDVRILDEGVMKMFRLAQLAVEYQQFCRQYLDRSVYVLREEITGLAQELDVTKKNLLEKEEEVRRLKRKTKHRTPLPYGNDNIATMILKTLSHKNEIFGMPSTSNADTLQYNKCSYCDKVFLNQLYLKSHLNRRHSNMLDVPQKDLPENVQNTCTSEKENPKLNEEIVELKNKLKEMENLLLKVNSERNTPVPPAHTETNEYQEKKMVEKIIMKDAEVSANTENFFDKLEEWKKEEHEKYNKEINLLRAQIVDIVNSFKNKNEEKSTNNESNLIEQLNTTINKQGAEIHALKQELSNTRLITENEELERKKETEVQMSFWAKRVEAQTKQYEALLQKLNEVAQEAREARAQAETERARAAELQVLLQESLKTKIIETDKSKQKNSAPQKIPNGDLKRKTAKRKPKLEADPKTLESLHKKAQEILNLRSISSSDISSSSTDNSTSEERPPPKYEQNDHSSDRKPAPEMKLTNNRKAPVNKTKKPIKKYHSEEELEVIKEQDKKKNYKLKHKNNAMNKIGNGTVIVPGSPIKLVRAKITEEVNNRLVSIGVDPLKKRLPKNYFQKQKMQLQQQHEIKSKKSSDYQKVKHSILAYLDSSTSVKRNIKPEIEDYISPNKISKAFSLTSVISNVKNKALSLVKPHDTIKSNKRKELNAEVAKKAMTFLKTPPSSAPSSPIKQRKADEVEKLVVEEIKPRLPRRKILTALATIDKEPQLTLRKPIKKKAGSTDEDSSESDHKYYNSAIVSQSSKSIETLIKSPARRPSSASADYPGSLRKLLDKSKENLLRSHSAVNITEYKVETHQKQNESYNNKHGNSSVDIESLEESPLKKLELDESIPKQTKSVLKNASSTSSLNKKKVLFDMDAIQMKSVSASPSQSITEKSDKNEKFELGLINLDGEEWDISSIENEPLKEDTKIQVSARTSPKIAELKHTIESQLARRSDTPTTMLVGGVNLMPNTMMRTSSIAGSNTSLGSSILDESDGIPTVNNKAFTRSKKIAEKDDSEVDISEYSLDGMTNKRSNDSF